MNDPRVVNLSDLAWTPWAPDESVKVEIKDPARSLGSILSGLRVLRVAPGKASSWLHRHFVQEEMYLILCGSGLLRHAEREVPVRAGDFILYRAGDPAAHAFVNTGDGPLELIATGNRVPHEVCEYPERGTVYIEALDRTVRNEEVAGSREPREAWYKAGR
jgi:uncharacterized cupin superfamily protein